MKVTKEKAREELDAWLDRKKVLPSLRETYEHDLNMLVDAISEGFLSIDEKGVITHTLLFEIGEEEQIKQLQYKPRLNDKMLRPYLNGVKGNDGEGRLMAFICALTDQARGVISELDTADKKIASSIALFFL